jgi:WD40 repeat protein
MSDAVLLIIEVPVLRSLQLPLRELIRQEWCVNNRVRIYDYKRRKPLAILKYHTETVTGVTFREDMKWMATSSRDSTIALWSLYPPSSLQQNQELVNSGGSS